MTDEDAAYAAAQWASGIPQHEIALTFGYKGPSTICMAIERFLRKFTPTAVTNAEIYATGKLVARVEERRAMVPKALQAFKAQRESAA